MLHSVKKKGFTLIELLIVIVVIGILAAGIMIAASEMEASSKAAKIINDLKQLETAAMSWYWDNYGTLQWSGTKNKPKGDGYTIGGVEKQSLHKLVQNDNTIITKYLGNANFSLNEGNDKYTSESPNGLYAKLNGYSVYVGKIDDMEIDFVAQNDKGNTYIQVSASVRDENTLQRELRPLKAVKDNYPKLLLTLDDDPDGDYEGIIRKNALDWLMSN